MLNQEGTVVLETARLILRGLNTADAPLVFKNWTSDPEVTKFLRWTTHNEVKVTEEWIRTCFMNSDPAHYDWGIILKDSNEPIGSIGAIRNAEDPQKYEIGYALSRKHWGQGYTTEALQGMINYLSKKIGIKHFISSHAKENPASGAVMRHVGFKYVKDGSYQSFDGLRRFESMVYSLDIES